MSISKIKEINKIIEDTFLISENPDKEQKGYSYPCYVTKFQYECIKEQLDQQILSLIEELEGKILKDYGQPITARRFWLMRTKDVSGVSGTGCVADGVIFPDGIVVLRWRTMGGSTAIYDSIEKLEEIHGHQGNTKIEYVPEAIDQMRASIREFFEIKD